MRFQLCSYLTLSPNLTACATCVPFSTALPVSWSFRRHRRYPWRGFPLTRERRRPVWGQAAGASLISISIRCNHFLSAVALVANNLGNAISFLVGPAVVPDPNSASRFMNTTFVCPYLTQETRDLIDFRLSVLLYLGELRSESEEITGSRS